MSLPLLNMEDAPPERVFRVLQERGAALVTDPRVPAGHGDQALRDAAWFFALPEADKDRHHIRHSPHFRGFSRLQGERDHREQLHFGRERGAGSRPEPCWRLQGPNCWPGDPAWRARLLGYVDAVEQVGLRLLDRLAAALRLDARRWLGSDPYLLAKCIGYHPQVAGSAPRRGVAAHLDFSLITLTLQDGVGGLEIRSPDGKWHSVPPTRGAWLVHIGELLQFVTGNRLPATPHRVVNPSMERLRCSLPVFVNPSLDTVLHCELPRLPTPDGAGSDDHVHAVLPPSLDEATLAYGAGEWRRKGENRWCWRCVTEPG